jgi:hypothetical protein
MKPMIQIAMLTVVVGGACSKDAATGQSFHDAMQLLCDVPDHVPPPNQPYDKRLAEVVRWSDANITNPEARAVGSVDSLEANQTKFADAVKRAGIEHCKMLDNGMVLQSFADAMVVVCNAPADQKQFPAYFTSHLLNPEVVRMLAALGDAAPGDRKRILVAAVQRAKIEHCAFIDRASP